MTPKGRTLNLSVVVLIVLDTVRSMFGDSRPIDVLMLVIEFLVLAIIAFEGVHAIARSLRKRSITKRIFSFWQDGQALQDKVPGRSSGANDPAVADWNREVVLWTEAVSTFLKEKCSDQAVVSFQHYVAKPRLSMRIAPDSETMYVTLETRLENLRSIMEKPDVYF